MADLCDVCGAQTTRTPTGGWQCEPCDGITALREALVNALAERDRWKANAEYHMGACGRCYSVMQRQRDLIAMWHGKYAIVKHENNVLRRRLYRTGRPETDGD